MSFLENLATTANKALGDLSGIAIRNLDRDGSTRVNPTPTQALPAPVTAPAGVATSVPFYQQAWFLPVAIGGAVLLAVLYIFRK